MSRETNQHINDESIEALIQQGETADLSSMLSTWQPGEIADLISTLSEQQRLFVFNALSIPVATRAFEFLPFPMQREILNALSSEKAAYILNELSPDDRTAFLEELPSTIVNQLLKLLSPTERALTLKLLGYPENSVGRLMTPDYLAIKAHWTVREVLEHIRKFGHNSETIDVVYVVDEQGHLIDDIQIREFLIVPSEYRVDQIMDNKFIALMVTDDNEKAIHIFRENNRVALPVLDVNNILLGIVTIDDILNLAQEEATEDIQKIGGMEALDEPYMLTPFLQLMRKRVGWLIILFIGETFTATAMSYFQAEIAKAVVLSLFIPLIISSGGNSGSQASSLIIRAMALEEIRLRDWWRVMRREVFSGLFLGSVLGFIGFFRIVAWSQFTNIYGPHWFLVACTVAFALIGVVLWGTLMGSMLPLLLKRLGTDPATSSAPFVATLVDVTGIIIYFGIALIILQGTLL